MEAFLSSLLEPSALTITVEIVLGIVLSFMVDWVPGFTELSARAKRLYWLIVPIVFAVGAVLLLSVLGHASVTGENIFGAVAAGFAVFFGSQGGHTRNLSTTAATRVDII